MTIKLAREYVVNDGSDPITAPVLEYLRRKYGMPAGDVKALSQSSRVGEPLEVTVTVHVDPAVLKEMAIGPMITFKPGTMTAEEVEEFGRRMTEALRNDKS
jgi:hypothetical protein